MSEPRRLNTGDAQRNVYHAGDAAPSGAPRPTIDQQQFEEARRRARAAASTGGRRTRQFSRVQQSDVDRYQAQQAAQPRRTVQTGGAQQPARTVRQPAAQQPAARAAGQRQVQRAPSASQPQQQELTTAQRQALALQRQAAARQAAAATRPQVQRLDLNKAQPARGMYDVNSDAAYQARQAARPAQPSASASQPAGRAAGAAAAPAAKSGRSTPAGGRGGPSGAGGSGGGKPPKNGGRGKDAGSKGGKTGKNGKKKRRMPWWGILLCTLGAIAVILLGTFFFIMRSIAPETGSISLNQLINTPKEYAGKEFNLLVVGVDRSTEDGSGEDSQSNDGLTDMILYLHFNNETGDVRMLQIPRNILVTDDASVSGNYMINGVAKTQGTNGNNNISALAQLIYDQFDLPVDGYISIRLEALTQMIDTFGGIQVYVPQEMDYKGSHLDAGYQTMDGDAAEFFLRTRHIYADSDIGRLNMQRYFYAALFARLRSMTVWDIAKLLPVFVSYMETDLSASDLVSVAVSMLKISSDHIMMCQVPVYMGQINYPIGTTNDVVVVDRQGTADLLNTYFRENQGTVDASALGVRDDLVDVSGRTPTDPSVQFMGSLNEEIADAQQNDNIDGSATSDVYDTGSDSAAASDGTSSASSDGSSSAALDDAA